MPGAGQPALGGRARHWLAGNDAQVAVGLPGAKPVRRRLGPLAVSLSLTWLKRGAAKSVNKLTL